MSEPVRFQHFEVPLREDGSLFELGRGAMGITYKAFDTNLRCFVALKVINATYLASDVARQRFLREARAAAALRHPNVATVFHLGEEGGNCFYAMEFVDGETVEALMKREGAIPAATALEVVIQVARALGAAQKQGLVHRDIKPSNLMLVREDDHEFTVKVIDFGLAKSSAGGNEDAATLTVGGFLGTPHFASPEQLEERDLDVRSDIYSLGVTLYYMLAGRAPFSGSLAQVMSQHLHRDPPLEVLTGQAPAVVDLLRHMLAKDPSGRPATPADLRREAEACLAAVRDLAPAPGTPPQPGEECFETQALDEPPAQAGSSPRPGAEFAGRYRIVREVQASDFGKTFEAEHLKTSERLELLVVDPSLAATAEAAARIESEVAALQALDCPALQKIHGVERFEGGLFLTLEWVEGTVLLDLMRARKALPPSEVLAILRPLAAGFQAIWTAGLPCPDISSHEVIVAGANPREPVADGALVKFNPFSPGPAAASPDATLVSSAFSMLRESGAFQGDEGRCTVYAVASLAYEMLGGVKSASPIPIPGLSEEANAALRRALDPTTSFESLEAFFSALESGCHRLTPAVPPQPPKLPEAPPRKASRPPVVLAAAGGILVLLAVAGAALFFLPKQGPSVASATPPTAAPSPTPPPLPVSTPAAPTPAPTATPDPVESRLAAAREMAASDPAAALEALLELRKSFPEAPEIREALVEFASGIRSRRESLTPGQAAALREPLEAAASLDIVDAQILLGDELRDSQPKESLKWILAAAKNGDPDAMLKSGLMLSNGVGAGAPDLREAAAWFQRAAEAGDPRAMFALSECYLLSKGVTRDPARALEWLNKSAASKNVEALNKLGDLHTKGIPGVVPVDLKKAFAYFSEAKDLGFAPAFGNLGALFMTAPEGMKDEKLAVDMFRQGADHGDPRSVYFYAVCLEDGLGELPKDPAAARPWYVQAAELGNPKAQEWCQKNKVPFTPPARAAR